MNEIKIANLICNRPDASKIFDEVMTLVEKRYESILGTISVIFEDQLGSPRKSQITNDTTLDKKT